MPLVRKGVDSTVKGSLIESGARQQLQNHTSFTREPLVSEIPDQGFVLAVIAGTGYIYTRIGNQRYYVALTAV